MNTDFHPLTQQADDESFEFDYILESIIPGLRFKNINASSLKVNTMTVVCKPSKQAFQFSVPDIKKVLIVKQEQGELDEGMTLSTKCLGKNCIIFKWTHTIRQDEGKKNISIKVFGNGSIHIVGVTRPIQALLISNYFFNLFEDILRDGLSNHALDGQRNETLYDLSKPITRDLSCVTGLTDTYSICMIQSNFEIDRALFLKEVREQWDIETGSIIYNKDSRHPGLQIKFKDISTSCILFASGKILITGATKPEHLEDVYKIVCEFIDRKHETVTHARVQVEKKTPGKRGRKRKAEHDAFYEEFDIQKELM